MCAPSSVVFEIGEGLRANRAGSARRATMLDVRGVLGRLVVAALLAMCVCIYALEMSGRWDRSIEDANDEAGFVAIVLCIGVALAAAGSLIAYIRDPRT